MPSYQLHQLVHNATAHRPKKFTHPREVIRYLHPLGDVEGDVMDVTPASGRAIMLSMTDTPFRMLDDEGR